MFHIGIIAEGNPVKIEVVKALSEDLALLQHQVPAQAAPQAFRCQMLEHVPVIMHRGQFHNNRPRLSFFYASLLRLGQQLFFGIRIDVVKIRTVFVCKCFLSFQMLDQLLRHI